ncbi:MAG: hypothetical protein U0Y68_13110 [Blastocatellia bacterium]
MQQWQPDSSEIAFTPANHDSRRERGCLLRIWEYWQGHGLAQGRRRSTQHFRAALQHRAVEWHMDLLRELFTMPIWNWANATKAIAEYERILKINPRYPLIITPAKPTNKGDHAESACAYQQFLVCGKRLIPTCRKLSRRNKRIAR